MRIARTESYRRKKNIWRKVELRSTYPYRKTRSAHNFSVCRSSSIFFPYRGAFGSSGVRSPRHVKIWKFREFSYQRAEGTWEVGGSRRTGGQNVPTTDKMDGQVRFPSWKIVPSPPRNDRNRRWKDSYDDAYLLYSALLESPPPPTSDELAVYRKWHDRGQKHWTFL